MNSVIRDAFEREWSLAGAACDAGDLATAFHHLERAHILGQRSTLPFRLEGGSVRVAHVRVTSEMVLVPMQGPTQFMAR